MAVLSKIYLLSIIATLVVSCLIMVNLSTASVPKPAFPQFTVQYTNGTVQVVIKNQQYSFSMGQINYRLYYNVRVDPHYGLGWKELYPLKNGTTGPNSPFFEYVNDPENSIQSNSENTIITFHLDDTSYVSSEGKNDFQVEAIVGHDSHIWTATHVFFPEYGGYTEYAVVCDATSGWSDTVTLNLNENALPNQIPTSQGQPTTYQIDLMTIGLLVALCVIAILLAVIALMYRKQTKNVPVQSS